MSKIPKRMIVALVPAANYHGHVEAPPFKFVTGDLKNIRVQAGSETIPFRSWDLDYDKGHYSRAYLSLMCGMGVDTGTLSLDITPSMFANGHALYVFDILPGQTGDFTLTRLGDTSITFEFSEDTAECYAICVIETDGFMNISSDREPSLDTLV